MFRWFVEQPATLFGFLSGIFMSVSTTALSNFALAEQAPGNTAQLTRSAIAAFIAAACWFLLGERLTALKQRVKDNQEGLAGTKEQTYAKALDVLARTESWKLYLLVAVAIAASVSWPYL